jgi:glycosyltransferase involved in cell wall biosynthesis
MARIVFDGLPLQVRSAGVAVYTTHLVRAMAALRPDAAFVFLAPPRFAARGRDPGAASWPANVRWCRSLRYPLIMGLPRAVPRLVPVEQVVGDCDVFHATAYAAPRTRTVPVVLSVHDLALMRFPELGGATLAGVVERTRRAVGEARLILASSDATRRDLIELAAAPAERVRVVHLGCDASFHPLPVEAARAVVRQRYGVDAPYLLHLGTLEPRKNLARLVRAYARLRGELRDPPSLVLAGERGWKCDDVFRLVDELNLRAQVRFTGRVDDADLPVLFNAAAVFVYPSLYEGFGLPPLEAMACGVPVVCSNVASLPEVVGDAALLVDPLDEEGLTAALRRVLEEPALRADLRQRGLERARRFSWQRCAEATLAAYADVAR